MQWFEYVLIFVAAGFVILVIVSNVIKKKKHPKGCCDSKDCIGDCPSCSKGSALVKQYRQNHPYMYTLHVEGMKCGECEAHINDEIRRHFDVKKVMSDRNQNRTMIVSDKPLEIDSVKEAIRKLGYTVN